MLIIGTQIVPSMPTQGRGHSTPAIESENGPRPLVCGFYLKK
jgi:hypothetical protein